MTVVLVYWSTYFLNDIYVDKLLNQGASWGVMGY